MCIWSVVSASPECCLFLKQSFLHVFSIILRHPHLYKTSELPRRAAGLVLGVKNPPGHSAERPAPSCGVGPQCHHSLTLALLLHLAVLRVRPAQGLLLAEVRLAIHRV